MLSSDIIDFLLAYRRAEDEAAQKNIEAKKKWIRLNINNICLKQGKCLQIKKEMVEYFSLVPESVNEIPTVYWTKKEDSIVVAPVDRAVSMQVSERIEAHADKVKEKVMTEFSEKIKGSHG